MTYRKLLRVFRGCTESIALCRARFKNNLYAAIVETNGRTRGESGMQKRKGASSRVTAPNQESAVAAEVSKSGSL